MTFSSVTLDFCDILYSKGLHFNFALLWPHLFLRITQSALVLLCFPFTVLFGFPFFFFCICVASNFLIFFIFIYFSFIFISWRLITLQYCSGFCHTLTWISHGFTCIPHPDPPSHLPLHPIPLASLFIPFRVEKGYLRVNSVTHFLFFSKKNHPSSCFSKKMKQLVHFFWIRSI